MCLDILLAKIDCYVSGVLRAADPSGVNPQDPTVNVSLAGINSIRKTCRNAASAMGPSLYNYGGVGGAATCATIASGDGTGKWRMPTQKGIDAIVY